MRNVLIAISFILLTGWVHAGAYDDILHAVEKNETAAVVDLLKRGMDVNTADRAGTTLLMIAARNGNLDLLQTLLNNRASINRRNQFGDSALLLAALNARFDAAKLLMEKGAEVNPSGWTPLHYAVFGGNPEILGLLIARGANLDARAPNGQTALMVAVKLGKLDLVTMLIDADADMDLTDQDGVSALQLARKLGHKEIANYLRKVGAVE